MAQGRLNMPHLLFAGKRPYRRHTAVYFRKDKLMTEQDFDLDNLDTLLEDFDGVSVEGGVDAENQDDNCVGGACKI